MIFVAKRSKESRVTVDTLEGTFRLMFEKKLMTLLYEEGQRLTNMRAHAASRGHEAIQIALGLQLKPQDFVTPYYRDDSILLSIGMQPHELILQKVANEITRFRRKNFIGHASLIETI